jgi:hypothetical protein
LRSGVEPAFPGRAGDSRNRPAVPRHPHIKLCGLVLILSIGVSLTVPNRVDAVSSGVRTDSRMVLANTKSTRLVSFGDPLEPSGAGNA